MKYFFLFFIVLLVACSSSHPTISVAVNDSPIVSKNLSSSQSHLTFVIDKERMKQAFEKFQEIGSGRNFLTVMVDLPHPLPYEYTLSVLALDSAGEPVRKITGFNYNPNIEGKYHTWFYLFLYAPGDWKNLLSREGVVGKYGSSSLKFCIHRGNELIMETVVKCEKAWAEESSQLVADLPAAPDEIVGSLELKDYTFFAKGDLRKPQGYYIEGKVIGSQGEWVSFVPFSGIKGEEPEPEIVLPSDQGWLELSTGRVHSMKEAVSPLKPYIEGWWDSKGYFHPKGRIINY